jgi:PiT family inorganic phosphate transporter
VATPVQFKLVDIHDTYGEEPNTNERKSDIMALDIIVIVGAAILLSLVFDFTNGFHDASSVVATVIACGALNPKRALLLAGVFTILGAILGGSAVVYTIQKIIFIDPGRELVTILVAAMVGAIFWNLLTWKYGLPSSSTHAMVGGLVGATVISAGTDKIQWGISAFLDGGNEVTGIFKVMVALLVSPPLGFGLAFLLQKVIRFSLKNSKRTVNIWLKRVQVATAALLAYSHGANDTQKHMGIIMLALLSGGVISTTVVPIWLRLLVGGIMLIGTLGGGWTIMKTLGHKIYPLEPIHSFTSQIASSTSVLMATFMGGPISTTHVVGTSVMGAGAGDELKMVSWDVGKDMILSWFITIPASAGVAALFFLPVDRLVNFI